MSADNGVYILENLGKDGKPEYRIAYCSAVENIFYDRSDFESISIADLYTSGLFGKSEVYYDKSIAILNAHKIADNCDFLEYGVKNIKQNKAFPNISSEEAWERIDNISKVNMEM